jgi:formylglycine-generating enzyme required for sulfatase activity
MALVDGEYCTEVVQTCVDWMEPPTAGGTIGRCRKFAPSVCKGARVHQKFCIDKDEYTPPGESLPRGNSNWTEAKQTCESMGKRLCKESEWNFACEGEEMLPYPIGLERDSSKCNYDQMHLFDPWGKLADLRKPSAELTQCVSPFGVRNMTGNVDEWTYRDVTYGQWRSAMKGGWWMAARNRCRPATTAHDEHYRDIQAGFRCCSETK